jgi:hypothetical protein
MIYGKGGIMLDGWHRTLINWMIRLKILTFLVLIAAIFYFGLPFMRFYMDYNEMPSYRSYENLTWLPPMDARYNWLHPEYAKMVEDDLAKLADSKYRMANGYALKSVDNVNKVIGWFSLYVWFYIFMLHWLPMYQCMKQWHTNTDSGIYASEYTIVRLLPDGLMRWVYGWT